MELQEWISRFDNEEADKLTQDEQIEIKSMLIELRWRRGDRCIIIRGEEG